MRFSILFLVAIFPFCSYSVAPEEILEQVIGNSPECNSEIDGYSPKEALLDLHNGELVFMGRDMFPGNGQNRTCVYRSKAAYILYHNCQANKLEASATDIEVISFNGGMARFYILNNKVPISELQRSDYDVTWSVEYQKTPAPGVLDLNGLKAYKSSTLNTGSGCFIGSVFKPQDMSSKAGCYGNIDLPGWKLEAEQFWREPGEEWYRTKKYLRKVVVNTKF